MINNCLVKKLKSVVSNDNLNYLGGLLINVTKDDTFVGSKRSFTLKSIGGNLDLEIIDGNAFFTDSTGSVNNGQTRTITDGNNPTIYISNDSAKILVKNKYCIASITFPVGETNCFSVNIGQLDSISKYSSNLSINGVFLSGDISNFYLPNTISMEIGYTPNLSGTLRKDLKFSTLNIASTSIKMVPFDYSPNEIYIVNNSEIEGDIKDFIGLNTTSFDLFNTLKITGSAESVFEKLWDLGKRDGTFYLRISSPQTWKGNTSTGNTLNATFDANGIILKNPSNIIVATYDGSTWTYNN